MNAWFYLLVAGIFEMVWAVGIVYTEGFRRPVPSVLTLMAMALSVWFLSLSLKTLPLGTAYAVWTGIGGALTVVAGMVLFHEPVNLLKIGFIGLILLGIIGLKLTSGH